ncbi:cardiotrophin-1-like [Mixophyes fleayi]|uniref:cardiotrophin-1-like n=1 Tax=Mixophyes fleayi TaxID=3061075 RepID=UPI003F4DD1F3
MEIVTVDHRTFILSLQQEQDGKEAMQQAYLKVLQVMEDVSSLTSEYSSKQGSFSSNGSVPQIKIEDLPILDKNALPSSPWKRLALSLSAFLSLSEWFASVLLWQQSLNPGASELLKLLEMSKIHCKAISSNLAAVLGQQDLSTPSLTTPNTLTTVIKQKIAGFMVCKCFTDWLSQTERDLLIVIAESPV